METIVVTGIGLVTSLGTGREAAWRAFVAGESGVRALATDDPRRQATVDPSPIPDTLRAGWVRGFEPRAHIQSPLLRRMDWGSRMLVAATRLACGDASLLPLGEEDRPRVALVVGSFLASQRDTAAYLRRIFTSGLAAGQPFVFPNLVLNAAAGYAGIELGLAGPNLSLSEHEASGEVAIVTAVDLLASGGAEIACAGGFDELGDVLLDLLARHRVLAPGSALRSSDEAPDRRPGTGSGDGLVPGEGAAMVVLETASHARRRGAPPLAEIEVARVGAVGASPYGLASDPEVAAGRLLELAGLDSAAATGSASISAVFGTADGSRARGALDAAVLRRLATLQDDAPAYVPFRSLTGEWGAAGALGVALASLAIASGEPPPAIAEGYTHGARQRIARALVVGAGRSGVLAPIVVARPRTDG